MGMWLVVLSLPFKRLANVLLKVLSMTYASGYYS